MNNQNDRNELIELKTLEDRLSVELAKTEDLRPPYPIDQAKVMAIDSSEKNKAIILAAYNHPRIQQYPPLAQRFRLLIAINKTILFVGHNVQDIEFLYKGVLEFVREDAKHLTMEELEIAFKNGSMDEYGEWHGLSAMTFCKWIKGYVTSTKRQAMAEKEKIRKMDMVEKEPTPEERYQNNVRWIEYVIESYENYLQCDDEFIDYEDYLGRFYALLYHLKLINLSNKEREKFKRQATTILRRNRKLKIDDEFVKTKAKQFAVKDWFKEQKKNQVQLRSLLEQNNVDDYLKML